MKKDTLSLVVSLIGAVLTGLGLITDERYLVLIGILGFIVAGVVFALYRAKSSRYRSAELTIDGHSIDSLNLANLRRVLNKTLHH